MINGVLAERTVKDVIPALRTTAEGLKKVLDDLVKQYKTKQDELDRWKVCGRIPRLSCCVIVSDLPHRKRTMSRLCSHESAAAPLTRVSEATLDTMPLSDTKSMAGSLKSSGKMEYWRHPWINLMPFAYRRAVREGGTHPAAQTVTHGKRTRTSQQKRFACREKRQLKAFPSIPLTIGVLSCTRHAVRAAA